MTGAGQGAYPTFCSYCCGPGEERVDAAAYEALLLEVEGLKAALLRIRAECAAPVSADAQREAVHSAYNIATAALSPASGGV